MKDFVLHAKNQIAVKNFKKGLIRADFFCLYSNNNILSDIGYLYIALATC